MASKSAWVSVRRSRRLGSHAISILDVDVARKAGFARAVARLAYPATASATTQATLSGAPFA